MAESLSLPAIESIFQESMNIIKSGMKDYQINCSDNVIFGGCTDDSTNPVQLAFNKSRNVFILFFSNHYLMNSQDKILKLFVRYIITTNKNGTFKNRKETKKELKKFTDTHYEACYMNNFLKCDETISDTIFCRKCKRTYKYPINHPIFQHLENYRCECGGELTKLINTGTFDSAKANVYFSNNFKENVKPGVDTSKYPDSFFEKIQHSVEDYERFVAFIKNKKRISRLKLIGEIQEVIDNENYNMLNMYNFAFPKMYDTVFNYIKAEYRNVMKVKCPPSFIKEESKSKKVIVKEELNRTDFNCTDEDFSTIKNFNNGKHNLKCLNPYIINAIENDKVNILKALQKIDNEDFQKSVRYLKKKQKTYLIEHGMVVNDDASFNQINE